MEMSCPLHVSTFLIWHLLDVRVNEEDKLVSLLKRLFCLYPHSMARPEREREGEKLQLIWYDPKLRAVWREGL
jgi:hypothetical protein